MEEVVNCLKSLLIFTWIFNTAFFICMLLIINFLRDIPRGEKNSEEEPKKEIVFAVKCIGRKPTECISEWFTINKEYAVRDNVLYDDQGYKWYLFKYDKKMLEAGGYLFSKVKES